MKEFEIDEEVFQDKGRNTIRKINFEAKFDSNSSEKVKQKWSD